MTLQESRLQLEPIWELVSRGEAERALAALASMLPAVEGDEAAFATLLEARAAILLVIGRAEEALATAREALPAAAVVAWREAQLLARSLIGGRKNLGESGAPTRTDSGSPIAFSILLAEHAALERLGRFDEALAIEDSMLTIGRGLDGICLASALSAKAARHLRDKDDDVAFDLLRSARPLAVEYLREPALLPSERRRALATFAEITLRLASLRFLRDHLVETESLVAELTRAVATDAHLDVGLRWSLVDAWLVLARIAQHRGVARAARLLTRFALAAAPEAAVADEGKRRLVERLRSEVGGARPGDPEPLHVMRVVRVFEPSGDVGVSVVVAHPLRGAFVARLDAGAPALGQEVDVDANAAGNDGTVTIRALR